MGTDKQPEAPTTKAGRALVAYDESAAGLMPTELYQGVLAIEAEARAASQERPQEDGECECGQLMSAHAGGFALLHHDEVVARLSRPTDASND